VGSAEALGGLEQDGFGHAFGVLVHFAVPEADDRPAGGFEGFGAGLVGGGVEVLAPIDLDNQACFATREVRDVGAGRGAGG
jgi:hypothetical protein